MREEQWRVEAAIDAGASLMRDDSLLNIPRLYLVTFCLPRDH